MKGILINIGLSMLFLLLLLSCDEKTNFDLKTYLLNNKFEVTSILEKNKMVIAQVEFGTHNNMYFTWKPKNRKTEIIQVNKWDIYNENGESSIVFIHDANKNDTCKVIHSTINEIHFEMQDGFKIKYTKLPKVDSTISMNNLIGKWEFFDDFVKISTPTIHTNVKSELVLNNDHTYWFERERIVTGKWELNPSKELLIFNIKDNNYDLIKILKVKKDTIYGILGENNAIQKSIQNRKRELILIRK